MIITPEQIISFLLIFIRLISMMSFAPAFSDKAFFSLGKVTFLLWVSSLVLFFVPLPVEFPNTPIMLIFSVLVEIVVGALLGFIAQMFTVGIEIAGALMDTQAGLSVASLLDPSSGHQTTILAKFLKLLGILIFLLIDGHHVILAVIVQSFSAVPLGTPIALAEASKFVVESGIQIFEIGLQLSAPILIVVFLVDFGFGMLSRVAPQVNVFQLGFQVKPIISVFTLLTITPGLVDMMYFLLERISDKLLRTLYLLTVS